MKKLQLCILGSLFAASLQAQSTDYTKGLSIWFDTPNNLDGRASWYSPATDKAWENNSLPSTDWPIMSQAVKHLFASAPLLHWEKLTSKPV